MFSLKALLASCQAWLSLIGAPIAFIVSSLKNPRSLYSSMIVWTLSNLYYIQSNMSWPKPPFLTCLRVDCTSGKFQSWGKKAAMPYLRNNYFNICELVRQKSSKLGLSSTPAFESTDPLRESVPNDKARRGSGDSSPKGSVKDSPSGSALNSRLSIG